MGGMWDLGVGRICVGMRGEYCVGARRGTTKEGEGQRWGMMGMTESGSWMSRGRGHVDAAWACGGSMGIWW